MISPIGSLLSCRPPFAADLMKSDTERLYRCEESFRVRFYIEMLSELAISGRKGVTKMRHRPTDARTYHHSSLSALRAAWFCSVIVCESEMPFSGTASKPLRAGKAIVLCGHGESMAPAAQEHTQRTVSLPERLTDTRSLWAAAEFSGWCPPPRRSSRRITCFLIRASGFRSFSTSKQFLRRRSCLDEDEGENPMRCRTKPDLSE